MNMFFHAGTLALMSYSMPVFIMHVTDQTWPHVLLVRRVQGSGSHTTMGSTVYAKVCFDFDDLTVPCNN